MMAVDPKTINLDRAFAESDRQIAISRRQQALLEAAGMDGQKRWAILRVAQRRENDVDKALAAALIDSWLPLRKADGNDGGRRSGRPGDQVWVLAWPGYVFVHVVDSAATWAGLATIKHVKTVLGAGERPFFLSDGKLLKLKAELATLKALPKNAGMLFAEGDAVAIVDGPLARQNGRVLKVGEGAKAGRALVEVMIFGRALPLELDLAQLAK